MKKGIALLLVFLLSTMSVAAAAEVDFSSYTEAELRELRVQLDHEIAAHCRDDGKARVVCDTFRVNMQELGHPLLGRHAGDDFISLADAESLSTEITFCINDGYDIMFIDNFAADNEAYIRDCMVALVMAVAEVEGVEIFHNEIGTAMDSCMQDLPDDFFKDNICISWENDYGYQWLIRDKDGTTLVGVH